MTQPALNQALQVALKHHQAGRLPQAEQLYRQILARQPNHIDALHLLGAIAAHVGRNDAAVELIGRAISINPNFPAAHYNLGTALQAKGELDDAIAAYRRAIALHPNFSEAYSNLGNVLKQKGQLDEAIAAYRRAISLNPGYPEAHNNLGNALADKGDFAGAIASFRTAIALKPEYAEAHGNLGGALKSSGQIEEAIRECQAAISLKPNFPEAHFNLGNALQTNGQTEEAIAAYGQAIALRPGYAEAHGKLGLASKATGRVDAAIAAYRQAIALRPNSPEVLSNLGNALKDNGQLDEAVAAHQQAIALRPSYADAHSNLGNALKDKGQLVEAIAAYRQAIAVRPSYAEAHYNLGIALEEKGELDEAVAAFRKAIDLKPNYAEAWNNLGNALKTGGQFDQATVAYQRAIVLRPSYADAYSNLGLVLEQQGRLDEAIAAHGQAISLNPKLHAAYSNLGNALKSQGKLDEAIAAYRQALALHPTSCEAHSNLVYTLHFHAGYDAKAIAGDQRHWNIAHAEPLKIFIQPHANDRDPDRRLRIGYVSPDFYNHCQAHFMLPLLSAHDRRQVEIFCYADVIRPDPLTRQLQGHADVWRNIVGQSDEQVAAHIRQDQIDILVDLTMHMGHNRLTLFARKPAPVQVSWLAYPASTGLTAIDYRLSDPYLDPPGMDESVYSEKTIRLPDSFWCYDPLDGRDVPLNLSRAHETGTVTFGCLNNFCKVNDGVLSLWARVMNQVKSSRLLLLAGQGSHRQRTVEFMTGQGVDPARVEFLDFRPRREYFEIYRRIDVGLDSFPYNGHTTSLDSFWMGVPVVTLVGKTAVSRAGWCQLSNLGLTELAAQTPEQFVTIATELAGDRPRLGNLRSTLRQRMEQSPLMEAGRFARNIEQAYRRIWQTWCGKPDASG